MANINWAKIDLSKPDKVYAKTYGISTSRFSVLKNRHLGNWDNKTERVIVRGKSKEFRNYALDNFSGQVDWHRMTDTEIGLLTGLSKSAVRTHRLRRHLPPSIMSPSNKELRQTFWRLLDWKNLRNCEIMKEFNIPSPIWVSTMRKKFAPKTVRKQRSTWKSLMENARFGDVILVKKQTDTNMLRQAGNFCLPPRTVSYKRVNSKRFECTVLPKD